MNITKNILKERLYFIEFLAVFTGQVSRKDVVDRFGVSQPAATKDLSKYTEEISPNTLSYDLKKKAYVLSKLKPKFEHDVYQSLFALSGDRIVSLDSNNSEKITNWFATSIMRKVKIDVVSEITRSIFRNKEIITHYSSLTSGDKKRRLTPLSIINDGLRWHVRCFDHDKNRFGDFNLTRFSKTKEGDLTEKSLDQDSEWTNTVKLELIAHPKADFPDSISQDYNMNSKGVLSIELKKCLVGYFLRLHHIDSTEDASGNPRAMQLYLRNKKELLNLGMDEWAFK